MALEIHKRLDQPLNESIQLTNISSCFIEIGNFDKAKKYSDRALEMANKIGNIENLSKIYSNLYQIELKAGNYKLALDHYRRSVHFMDSFSNDKNTQRIVEQRMQYDFDKKEAIAKAEQANQSALSQKEIQKQRLIKNVFIGSFIIMLLFAFVFFQQRNKISKGKNSVMNYCSIYYQKKSQKN
ncbi:MAG: tetratricopeptide repeat protein [Bacteroidetes bacterium]|nr:tetratricopeptide repeat protein [Bacteroidota bacterium]